MENAIEKDSLAVRIKENLLRVFGKEPEQASDLQVYKATCMVMRDEMAARWQSSQDAVRENGSKQVFYLSMEFLPGTSLRNNAFNLQLTEDLRSALRDMGRDFDLLCSLEPDAGLGNGGLGRLASCYLDAMASQGMAGHGMSICYEYGIFRQQIKEGIQVELPDDWMDNGSVWLRPMEDEAQEVHFGGTLREIWDESGRMKLLHEDYIAVIGVPMDMLISGYDSPVVNTLRLWKATSPVGIDMGLFAKGQYLRSMEQKHMAEVISKVLYPEDAHEEGKTLRLRQQYFFISASLQSIVKKHLANFGTLENLHEKIAVHINDTHPAMAIPELMRILVDEHGYSWDLAWSIVTRTISYTNHTIMPEALEKWPEGLFSRLLPRIHSIIKEIHRRQQLEIMKVFPGEERLWEEMSILHNGQIRMANLCVAASHGVNGVSSLHSRIIREGLFNGYYRLSPGKFTNVTNGIAYRRWLCQANPELTAFIEELCGPGFRKDPVELEKLLEYREDLSVLERFAEIKRSNKLRLASYIKEHSQIVPDPESIFDVQVKRLHEYKRQLLNLLHIMHLYIRIKEDPSADIHPRTFIFGAKAAAGYFMAKEVIRLAYHLSRVIEEDPQVRERIKIVFLENYSVSLSEWIMPAAEVSEQISLAGREASGTGNMKLMINGAVTLGTMDGANVEIYQAVGPENIFIFGMGVEEVLALQNSGTYNPWVLSHTDPDIGNVMKMLSGGIHGQSFERIMNSLVTGYNGNGDPFFNLADFASYRDTQLAVQVAYRDRARWNRMSLTNIAKAGIFSADRAVREYAEKIWNIPLRHGGCRATSPASGGGKL
ncbi:MAG: glycogen/starch/alpha-glucan phosphorylase [Firmicutes bacterium]|nr:glycogen/starch/alpha-glucan phosphorylase [Bacillota bacterium]